MAEDVNFKEIAKKYTVAGGMILNVVDYCCVIAAKRDEPIIYQDDIIEGIRAELSKEGKTI